MNKPLREARDPSLSITKVLEVMKTSLGQKPWKPSDEPGSGRIHERTWRRWLAGAVPAQHSLKVLAQKVWQALESSKAPGQTNYDVNRKPTFFANLKEVAPDAPCEACTQEHFCKWLVNLIVRAAALSTNLDLLVWRQASHNFISVREPQGRPLRPGDWVRLTAGLEAGGSAHLYLLWLTLTGRAWRHVVCFPWLGDFFRACEHVVDKRCSSVTLPEQDPRGYWEIDRGTGMETILLLARREPLSEESCRTLKKDLEAAMKAVESKAPLGNNPQYLLDFIHPKPVKNTSDNVGTRLPILYKPGRVIDPIYEFCCRLSQKVGPHFDAIHTLTVAKIDNGKKL